MKFKVILGAIFIAIGAYAKVPEPVITTVDAYSGFGVIAGRLESKPGAPVGISIQNGNIMYSTLTDFEGRWSAVVRLRSSSVEVVSWDLKNSEDRSLAIVKKVD